VDEIVNEVREEFLGFVELERTDAAYVSEAILKFLSGCGLELDNLRDQGYDSASVMAGKVSGVSTRILKDQPRAEYHDCHAHNLNLVIASSCRQVPDIRNLFDSLLTWFLRASAKRKVILCRYLQSDDIADLLIDSSIAYEDRSEPERLILKSMIKHVPKLCEIRWSARVQTLSSVVVKYKAIYLSLYDIASESCDADARSKALSFIKLLQSSAFISTMVSQQILSLNPLPGFTRPLVTY
jgi:hypothetical protein